jgi:hemoglobin/transferrin/lactoferrin receptor protein
LTYGAEWVLNDVTSTGTDEDISNGNIVVGPARYPQSEWSSYGLYASYRHKFNSKWIAQLGIRYNQYALDAQFDTTFYQFPYTSASLNQGALTGSAGIVYRPNNKWSISASAATGFRSPNVDDLGKVFDSGDGVVIVPNPDLKAEMAQNIEIGVARNLNSKFRFDISAYYTLLNNALVRREFTLNGQDSLLYEGEMSRINAIQNAAHATVYGVQGGIQWLISHELDDGTVSPSRHAAPLFGSSHIIFSQQAISFDFYCMYNGEKSFDDLPQEEIDKPYIYATDGDGNPYSPSWYTLNLKINFQPNSHFGFSGGVENITDQRYRTYSSGIVAAGRNVFVSAKLSF